MPSETKKHRIFVVNTGSTSTKLAFFHNSDPVSAVTINHSNLDLGRFDGTWGQFAFRLEASLNWLKKKRFSPSAVVGSGGLLKPIRGGTYIVSDQMISDAKSNLRGEHASNLGCALAQSIARNYRCPAYVVDPVSVDEFEPLARYSGHPMIVRQSLSHALNIHAVARREAEKLGMELCETNFIVAHLGGGISIAPVRGGKIIDVNDASSDGPFSPDRTGGLPLQGFIGLCYSGKYLEHEMRSMVMGKGGLMAYLQTNSAKEVEKRIESGDALAQEVYGAMAYQIAKEIGAMSTVLKGRLDAIILTGGLANSKLLTTWIKERVDFIAPVETCPGDDEMSSMAHGALRVLRCQEKALTY